MRSKCPVGVGDLVAVHKELPNYDGTDSAYGALGLVIEAMPVYNAGGETIHHYWYRVATTETLRVDPVEAGELEVIDVGYYDLANEIRKFSSSRKVIQYHDLLHDITSFFNGESYIVAMDVSGSITAQDIDDTKLLLPHLNGSRLVLFHSRIVYDSEYTGSFPSRLPTEGGTDISWIPDYAYKNNTRNLLLISDGLFDMRLLNLYKLRVALIKPDDLKFEVLNGLYPFFGKSKAIRQVTIKRHLPAVDMAINSNLNRF